ncbi:hypothetical protein R6Z07M_018163 [Ovis aries]
MKASPFTHAETEFIYVLDVLELTGFLKKSWCTYSRISEIYKSLDETLGKSLNARIDCRFKEKKIDGFGKFILFLL